jgi:carbonic anhydrase
MELFTDDVLGDLLADSLETAKFDGKAWSNPNTVMERAQANS